jgi:uncharacterized protein YkwD
MTIFPILITLLTLAPSPRPAAKKAVNPQVVSVAPSTVNKQLMLELVNNVRKKGCQCGDKYYPAAGPLVWNDLLEKAAQNHSNEMNKNDYFSHISADGSNGGARLDAIGYKWIAYAENIGMGYTTEKEVVDAWVKSPSHCKNLMGKEYKEMGVARAGLYWTQDFGSRQ